MVNASQRYLSCEDVAKQLGISVESVRRLVRDGQLNANKIGFRTIRISQHQLDEYLTGTETSPDGFAPQSLPQ